MIKKPTQALKGKPLQAFTEHFELRSMTVDDVTPDYIGWWNDPDIQGRLGSRPRGWTFEQASRHVAQFDDRWTFHLGIYTREESRLIGFTSILANPRTGISTSNRVLGDKAFWRQGVSKEVSAWTIPFVFEKLGMAKIKAEVRGPNASSIALCEYLGFEREGLLRQEIPTAEGDRLDVHVFGLLKDDWRKQLAEGRAPWSKAASSF